MASSSPIKGHLETGRGLKKPPRKSVPGLACSPAFTTYRLCVGSALMAPSLGFLIGGFCWVRWEMKVPSSVSGTCNTQHSPNFICPCLFSLHLGRVILHCSRKKSVCPFLKRSFRKEIILWLARLSAAYFQVPYCNLNPCGFSEFRDGWEYRSVTGRLQPGVGSTE